VTSIFALTTRGLESIVAREMTALTGLTITDTGYRRVAAHTSDNLRDLLKLRTADDVFLEAATWQGIARPRSTLAYLTTLSAALDLNPLTEACAQIRPIPDSPVFSVTASFVGKRNYSADEIKLACADGIFEAYGWSYTPDDAKADVNVRVFIEHETAYVGMRLAKSPLQNRAYKQGNLPGSTKPPVAAALLLMTGIQPTMRLLDPCCGAGTILVEAALMGAEIVGGDRDPAAVIAARANLRTAGVSGRVERWDAGTLPLDDASIHRIASNLPWGMQIETKHDLPEFYQRACGEMRRVLASRGKIALLTGVPDLVHFDDLRLEQSIEISLFGQNPVMMLFSSESG